jgi:uncharacterized membrane protein
LKAARLAGAGSEGAATPALAIAVPALLLALSVAGLGISSYLAYTHWADATIACGGVGNCNLVNNSEYAELAGIPVAFLGALCYAAMIASALVWLWLRPSGLAWPVMALWGLSVGGTLYSGYLTYVEIFVLEAICIYCVASAGVVLASFLVCTGWVIREAQASDNGYATD